MEDSTSVNSKIKHKNALGLIDPTISGIDIGDKVIHVAIPDGNGSVEVREFLTTTPELFKISTALKQAGVKTAVMEATGVYWIPLYEILEEEGLESVLVDAKSVKNVPGRKSDVVDCQWIQTLYSNGLLRAAFRPSSEYLKLRAYVRQRFTVIKNKQIALFRTEKALQLMNVKLSSAVSDIGSTTGINIIRAILQGERNAAKLAALRNSKCKKDEKFFVDALTGNFLVEHLFALRQAMEAFDFANKQLEECDRAISEELENLPTVTQTDPPVRDKDGKKPKKFVKTKRPGRNDISFDVRTALWRKSGIDLTALPGIDTTTALLIFAELGGTDVSKWKTEKEFASWLKLCPGNNISGGKRRKSKKQPCTNYISQALRMAALAAKKSKTAVGARIRRIAGRTDKAKSIKAGAHKLAHMVYFMCRDGWKYHEKGEKYYELREAQKREQRLQKMAKEMGYKLVAV